LYAIAPAKTGRTRGFALIVHATQALKKMAARGMLLALELLALKLLALECPCETHARRRGPLAERQDAKRYCDDCIAAYGLGV
jgi:hypothetical protein